MTSKGWTVRDTIWHCWRLCGQPINFHLQRDTDPSTSTGSETFLPHLPSQDRRMSSNIMIMVWYKTYWWQFSCLIFSCWRQPQGKRERPKDSQCWWNLGLERFATERLMVIQYILASHDVCLGKLIMPRKLTYPRDEVLSTKIAWGLHSEQKLEEQSK